MINKIKFAYIIQLFFLLSSSSFNNFKPLYKAVTISASEIQNLALGLISTVPSFPIGVCSPPIPLTESPKGLAISLAFFSVPSAHKLGMAKCREALIPVPMLVGHEVTTPKSGEMAHPPSILDSTTSTAFFRRSKTSFRIVPFFMHIILKWSSSPTQIMNSLSADT